MREFSMKITTKIFVPTMVAILIICGAVLAKNPVFAATPNDNCFDFSVGVINNYYPFENNNAGNPPCPTNVDIPSTIGGTTVTEIASSAFSAKNLNSVTIPSSVTTIGGSAFSYNQLTSIVIPNNVVNFGVEIFADNQISSATLPSGITSIPIGLLRNNLLTSINIPSSVTSIGGSAFSQNQLTNITIPYGVTTIEEGGFEYNKISTLIIPDSVTTLGVNAFIGNNISSLTLGNSLTTIGAAAFALNSLPFVIIPDNVISIEDHAFSGNSTIYSIHSTVSFGGTVSMPDYVDSFHFVKLYTASPNNPNNLTDFATLESDVNVGDFNQDGDTLDCLGGYLVNPAQILVRYFDSNGNNLSPDNYKVGDNLNDYKVSSNPTHDLNLYYRYGQSVSLNPLSINGYITPKEHTIVLGLELEDNTYSFNYYPDVPTKDIVSGNKDIKLVNSGTPIHAFTILGLAVLGVLFGLTYKSKKIHPKN